MNDVKMMLGKRAAEGYLFLSWCIVGPILMIVIRHLSSSVKNCFFNKGRNFVQTDEQSTDGEQSWWWF